MQTHAFYFDGKSSARQPVTLRFQDNLLSVSGEGFTREYRAGKFELAPPVGKVSRILRLADGGSCEIDDDAFVASLEKQLGHGFQGVVHRVENRLKYAFLALLATILLVIGFIQYGIPTLARVAAFSLPVATESLIGGETFELLERFYFEESTLSQQRQQELQQAFDEVIADVAPDSGYRLLFRNSEALGPNALALPGGTIVVTDALVGLVEDDLEFSTVMAHEIGHLEQRHALRHVLQSMGTGLVIVVITGDITSITSVAAAIPTALVEAGYSREMEREADDAAAAWLKQRGLPVSLFGGFLTRLEAAHFKDQPELQTPDEQSVGDYFSTHPATRERIERLEKDI